MVPVEAPQSGAELADVHQNHIGLINLLPALVQRVIASAAVAAGIAAGRASQVDLPVAVHGSVVNLRDFVE